MNDHFPKKYHLDPEFKKQLKELVIPIEEMRKSLQPTFDAIESLRSSLSYKMQFNWHNQEFMNQVRQSQEELRSVLKPIIDTSSDTLEAIRHSLSNKTIDPNLYNESTLDEIETLLEMSDAQEIRERIKKHKLTLGDVLALVSLVYRGNRARQH